MASSRFTSKAGQLMMLLLLLLLLLIADA
eukprot:SAG31_NODE_34006_length_337_cov_1.773109_1_plen_28_part_10